MLDGLELFKAILHGFRHYHKHGTKTDGKFNSLAIEDNHRAAAGNIINVMSYIKFALRNKLFKRGETIF